MKQLEKQFKLWRAGIGRHLACRNRHRCARIAARRRAARDEPEAETNARASKSYTLRIPRGERGIRT